MRSRSRLDLDASGRKSVRKKPQRTVVLTFRVTSAEEQSFKEEAAKLNVPFSNWVRVNLLRKPGEAAPTRSTRRAPVADPKLLGELVGLRNELDELRCLLAHHGVIEMGLLSKTMFTMERHLRRLAGDTS